MILLFVYTFLRQGNTTKVSFFKNKYYICMFKNFIAHNILVVRINTQMKYILPR